jgi:hypothetical protein
VPTWTLSELEQAIRAAWSAETCDPVDQPWSAANPARGQCGVTALVLNDLIGGDLVLADVIRSDGSRQGSHCWNRLPGGVDVDLTREQFAPDEVVQCGSIVVRPSGEPSRCLEQYTALRERVFQELGASAPSSSHRGLSAGSTSPSTGKSIAL